MKTQPAKLPWDLCRQIYVDRFGKVHFLSQAAAGNEQLHQTFVADSQFEN